MERFTFNKSTKLLARKAWIINNYRWQIILTSWTQPLSTPGLNRFPHHDAKICRNVWLLSSLGLSRYIWPMEFIVSLSMKNLNNCLREWYVKEAVDQPHNRESGTTRLYTILHMIWTSRQNGSAILNSVEPSKPRITERWENGMAKTIATMLYSLRVS